MNRAGKGGAFPLEQGVNLPPPDDMTFRKSPILSLGVAVLLIACPVSAQESMGPEGPAAAVEEEQKAGNYEACAAFRADIDADLGDVLNAG